MEMKYAGSEILKMAVEIEKKGRAFYDGVVKAIGDDEAKTVFQFLADEEVKHIEVFNRMLKEIDSHPEPNPYDDTEMLLYFRSLIEHKVFPFEEAGHDMRQDVGDPGVAIRIAISLEKDSILFYLELLSKVHQKDHPVVQKIIDEERDHIRRILKLKTDLNV